MNINNRILALSQLGKILSCFADDKNHSISLNELEKNHFQKIEEAIPFAVAKNGWFTQQSIRESLYNWSNLLTKDNLEKWLSTYNLKETTSAKKVGLILAGNIPLVGFHDIISVFLSGNNAVIKLSSDDQTIIPILIECIQSYSKEFESSFQLVDRLSEIDAVIATGSNNSARYFEHYFGKYPHIIRKNRTSVALLDGTETDKELAALANDILQYFGLGCRNVSKLFLPKDFDIDRIFNALYHFKELGNHNKFANNYDYNKAIYLLNKEPLLENGFLLMREAKGYHSPVAVLIYERYSTIQEVEKELKAAQDQLQCIVSHPNSNLKTIPFGKAQAPDLWDYADEVDTMAFLMNL